jgi:hypothetical protein
VKGANSTSLQSDAVQLMHTCVPGSSGQLAWSSVQVALSPWNGYSCCAPCCPPSLAAQALWSSEAEWEIDPRDLRLLKGEVLGSGSYGRVLAAEYRGTKVQGNCSHLMLALGCRHYTVEDHCQGSCLQELH